VADVHLGRSRVTSTFLTARIVAGEVRRPGAEDEACHNRRSYPTVLVDLRRSLTQQLDTVEKRIIDITTLTDERHRLREAARDGPRG
jgi:hypothetical protein